MGTFSNPMGGIGTDLRVSDPISLMEGTGTAPRGHGARVPGTGLGTGFQFGPSYDIGMAVKTQALVALLGCKSGTCGPTLVERSENEAARYQCPPSAMEQ